MLARAEVEKLAHLARLGLTESEAAEVTTELNQILTLIDQMQAVDTANLEPLAHPLDAVQRLRPDEVCGTIERERWQSIAPAVENGLYLVPKVIE